MQRREALKKALALLTATAVAPAALMMNSCQSEVGTEGSADAVDTFAFSSNQSSLIAELAERIIPKTDNIPGAKDVGVGDFIELVVKDCLDLDVRALFAEGADAFAAACEKATQKSFVDLSDEEKDDFITSQAEELMKLMEGDSKEPNPTVTFMTEMSNLTRRGYFTSKEVGTKVLIYDPIPGEYKGCIPYEEVGGLWAE